MSTRAELYKQAFNEHDRLVERVKRAEDSLNELQNYVWGSLDAYMRKLSAGIDGHQPEAWSILDMAVDSLLKLQAENAQLKEEVGALKLKVGVPIRKRLPDTRPSIVHKFSVASHEGYVTVGLFPDDKQPGEMFVVMAKEGSTVGGLMDTIGRLTSVALQSGVTMEVLCEKFIGSRFEPSGYTANADIKIASSIIDYVFRWLHLQFCTQPEASS